MKKLSRGLKSVCSLALALMLTMSLVALRRLFFQYRTRFLGRSGSCGQLGSRPR